MAAATGIAAQAIALLNVLEHGDEIVAARTLYGGTFTQLDVTLRKMGITTNFVDFEDPENFARAITPKTRIGYAETIANPEMTDPSAGYHGIRFFETFGDFGFTMKCRMQGLRTLGPALAPFNAFAHPRVRWVNYPGLASSRHHGLAQRYLPRGAGAVLTFGIEGGADAGAKFIESVEFLSHLANIGDAKTLVIHPASTRCPLGSRTIFMLDQS